MPDLATAPDKNDEAEPLGFNDPKLLKQFDAAFKNTQAVKEGRQPTEVTDDSSPAAGSATPAQGAAPAEGEGDQAPPAKPDPFAPPPSKNGRANWEALINKHKEEVGGYVSKITTLEQHIADRDTIAQERDQLRQQLQLLDIERDPQFQAEWTTKQKEAFARLEAVGGKAASQLAAIAQLPAGQHRDNLVTEMLKDLPQWQQGQVGAAMYDVFRLEADRKALLERSRVARQAEAEQHVAREAAKVRAQQATFDRVNARWKEVLEGTDPAEIEEIRKDAHRFYKGDVKLTQEQVAEFCHWGSAGPRFATQLDAALTENATLKKQLAALRGASPGAVSSSSSSDADAAAAANGTQYTLGKDGDIGDIIAREVGKAGLLRG